MSSASFERLALQGVGHVYEGPRGRTVALDGVDLEVERGRLTVVAGPSGSGKTTLVLVLAGLLAPTHGAVFWGKRDIGAMPDAAVAAIRAQEVGVTLQRADLVETLTALENVALPAVLARDTHAYDRARDSLERLQLLGKERSLPHELSGGERRRIALARALVAGSAFLLADEPTADLDPASAADVVEALNAAAASGVGVLAVSHDPTLTSSGAASYTLTDGRLKGDR
jgi:putative ABC transport system ATP-binding protein